MRTRSILPLLAAFGAFIGAAASAQDLPSGYGVQTPSGSVFTADISPGGDSDDYVLMGYQGMTVTAVVKPGKGSPFVADIQFVRPGGSVATVNDGFRLAAKGTTKTGTMTLDAPGWWQVRVRGVDLDTTGGAPNYSSGAYTVQVTYKLSAAQPLLPIISKSFKTANAAILTKIQQDDYRFQAYVGETITATLSPAKGSKLLPGLSLLRPDGTIVTGASVVPFNGKSAAISKFTIDQQGTWRLHVVGLDPTTPPDPKKNNNTTGPYTLAVKLGKVPGKPSLLPDVNHQYRFTIPAVSNAVIGYTLSFKGAAPVFNSFLDPSGTPVPGFNGAVKLTGYHIPTGLPIGNYTLTFDAPTPAPTSVTFASTMIPPKGTTLANAAKPRKATLDKIEPLIVISGVSPANGGADNSTLLTVTTNGKLLDSNDPDSSKIMMFVDHIPLTAITVHDVTVSGLVPAGMPLGVHDVVVQSSTGQVGVAQGAFEIVPPPTVTSIDPTVGSSAGGYDVVITGAGFSKLLDPQIVIDSLTSIVPVAIDKASLTDTYLKFKAPTYGSAGKITFGVVDNRNGNGAMLPLNSFEFINAPAINRIVPNLTTILGGDLIVVTGANFNPTDHVYLEKTPHSNTYDEIFNTYHDPASHRFTAPVKAKGVYNVYVTDQFGQPSPPRTRTLSYYTFTDLSTTNPGLFPSGSDVYDGVTNAVADFDKDGHDDLFISRLGGATAAAKSNTRVLRNDGAGHFVDVTTSVMPGVSSTEDWRADRIWVTDMNQDGYPDIVLVSNDQSVLVDIASHLRFLINEPRTPTTPNDRVFRDRTTDLFPAPRSSAPLYGGGTSVVDNYRGLDMWIGDIDQAAGPPEILITHKETKQEIDVSCGNYCSSPFAGGYTYGFYWGGSRAFAWNKTLKGGLGLYQFNRNFFPRKSGLRVPVTTPTGVVLPICNSSYGKPCVGKFPPYLGKRIAVGDLDADGKPDVAVVSDAAVTFDKKDKDGNFFTMSCSLEVAMNKFDIQNGILITDVSERIAAAAGPSLGDTIAIGQTGFPDSNSWGMIALTTSGANGNAMRLIKYKPPGTGVAADFEDVTSGAMPPPNGADHWQASSIFFRDIDNNGSQDMILVCNAAPGGTLPAFRILRNEISGTTSGVMRESLKQIISGLVGPNEHFEGDAAAIGDVNADGALDFVLTRASTSAQAPETRILAIDKQ